LRALARLAGTTFGSLRIRNYRLYFTGQTISVSGAWMQRVAQSWLVLHLTNSGVALGIVSALQFLPILLLGAFAGLAADRMDKRRLLLLTQSITGMLALVLGLVTLLDVVQLWMVYALALALGLVTVVDNPTRQSFVMEMVGRRQVANAVSLNSAVFTSARVVGPAIAGVLITLVGTGWCFVINGASSVAVVAALLAMDPAALHRAEVAPRRPGQLREGLRFVWSRPDLRIPLMLMAVVGTLALNFTVVLPLLARNTFHGGPATYGLLFSVLGLGSLAGALYTAGRHEPSLKVLITAVALFGLLMLAASAAPNLAVEVAVLLPMGMASVTFQTTGNSLFQLRSLPTLRGRVMSLYTLVFLGTTPIGAPFVGFVAEHLGPRMGWVMGGAAMLVAAGVAVLLLRRRPLDQRRTEPPAGPRMGFDTVDPAQS
jgi:MFS family permease